MTEPTPTAPFVEEATTPVNEETIMTSIVQEEEVEPKAPEESSEEISAPVFEQENEPKEPEAPIEEIKENKEVEGTSKTVQKEEEPKEKSTETTSGGFSFSMDRQKPLHEVSFQDVILWRNVYLSLFIFVAGHALYALLTKYEYSVITLVGRIMTAQILVFILLLFGYKYYKGVEAHDEAAEQFKSTFKLSEEWIIPVVKNFIQRFNNTTKAYTDILLLVNLQKTIQFLLGIQIVCFLGNRISGITLAYMLFLYGFTVPKIYEMKKKEIDEFLNVALERIKEQSAKLIEKLPPSVKVHVEKYVKVKND